MPKNVLGEWAASLNLTMDFAYASGHQKTCDVSCIYIRAHDSNQGVTIPNLVGYLISLPLRIIPSVGPD